MGDKAVYLCSDWLHNIGNGFIDMGGQEAISQATGVEPAVISASCQDLLLDKSLASKIKEWVPRPVINRMKPIATSLPLDVVQRTHENAATKKDLSDSFDMLNSLSNEYTYVVFGGMRLTRSSLSRITPMLSQFKDDRDGKIVILGAGGASYSDREVSWVREWFKEHEPHAFVARDQIAYQKYHDLATYSYNGIDSAFFLGDHFTPVDLDDREYVVFNFDRSEPMVEEPDNKEIVRTHHVADNIPDRYMNQPNSFVSSYLADYLNIYANSDAVYTDRLHACIPSLVFGTPCRYKLESKKNTLFDNVNIEYTDSELISPDQEKITAAKEEQVKFLSDVLS